VNAAEEGETDAASETRVSDPRVEHVGLPPIEETTAAKPGPQPSASAGAAHRAEQVAPDARDFAAALSGGLSTPGVSLALITGGVALAVALVVGLILGVALGGSEQSYVGEIIGIGDGKLKQILIATAGTTMARIGTRGYSFVLPAVLILAPAGGAALGAWWQADRTREMTSLTRIGWGAAGSVPLAAGMAIISLVASGGYDFDGFNVGGVILLSLLWGGLGGAIGTLIAIGPMDSISLPDHLRSALRLVRTPLISLAGVGIVLGLLGSISWAYAYLAGKVFAAGGQLTHIVDSILFGGNYAINGADIGMFAGFYPSVSMALPPTGDKWEAVDIALASGQSERIFAYNDVYPVWIFIPVLIIFVGLPILAGLYSGYSIARQEEAASSATAAGLGAITGIVWTVVLTIASSIFAVHTNGGSVFGLVLLVGAAAGAGGGLVYHSASMRTRPPQP
jgi:hypothetical protein